MPENTEYCSLIGQFDEFCFTAFDGYGIRITAIEGFGASYSYQFSALGNERIIIKRKIIGDLGYYISSSLITTSSFSHLVQNLEGLKLRGISDNVESTGSVCYLEIRDSDSYSLTEIEIVGSDGLNDKFVALLSSLPLSVDEIDWMKNPILPQRFIISQRKTVRRE